MATLDKIGSKGPGVIEVPSLPWLKKAIGEGFIRGGTYLLAGEPGIGKTALSLQLLGDLAKRGVKVLYVTTEQGLEDLKSAVERIHGDDDRRLPKAISENFFLDDHVTDLDALPHFLSRRVLTQGEEYFGAEVIVLDSVQGRGLSAAATRQYKALYEFTENAKAARLLTILIGHVTKKGQIAGPKDLEHNVDCILYIRRAFRLRPFFVPKNRFGPALLDPLVLLMDSRGRLSESPHATAKSTVVYGYGGIGEELAEGQASVTLPRYGSRPDLNAPFLPAKKVRQLLTVLSTLKDVDLADLSYEINCYLPRQQHYRAELDLPIAVALLSSYLQRPVPEKMLCVGELDLMRRIRAPAQPYLAALAELLVGPQKKRVETAYLSADCADAFAKLRPTQGGPTVGEVVAIRSVNTLDSLFESLWPDLTEDK